MDGSGQSRWQYVILWRYGALGLAVVGLAMMGCGASGLSGTPISLSLITLGFACLITGVVLPRIEGKFTAGTSGVTAELLAVHQLDSLTLVAPQERQPIKLGDVRDALEAAGFRVKEGSNGMGKNQLVGPGGRSIVLHTRSILGYAVASTDLLVQLESWGVRPAASGKYQFPAYVDPKEAIREAYSAVRVFTE